MRHYLFCCLVFFSILSLGAQSNWQSATVELTDGTVLTGQIDDRNWSTYFESVRLRRGKEVTKYTLADLAAFRVSDRRYVVREQRYNASPRDVRRLVPRHQARVERRRLALQLLIEGPWSLYESFDERGNAHFFLAGPDGDLNYLEYGRYRMADTQNRTGYVESNTFRGQLAGAIADCPRLATSLRKLRYKRSALLDLFERYYNCGAQQTGYWYTPERNVWLFGLDLGVTQSSANYGILPDQLYRFDDLTSIDPTFGVHAKYRFGGRNGTVSIKLAAMYHQYNTARSIPDPDPPSDDVLSTFGYLAEERGVHVQLGSQITLVRSRYPLFLESFVEYHHLMRYTDFQFNRQITAAGEAILGTPYDFRNQGALGLSVGAGVAVGQFTLSARATVTRRRYDEFLLNLYRLGLVGSYNF